MSLTERFGELVSAATVADLPGQALEHGAMLIASTLASAAVGIGIESAQILRALARDRGGRGDATLWFDASPRLPVAEAAQANAVASDAAASDDSDLRNIIHAGTAVVASALAMAERSDATGEDVLAAIVLGYEIAGRIGAVVTPGFLDRGYHGCLCAIFGATIAAGRLLSLDADQTAESIALSATSIGGLMIAANTSTAREYHAGLAALLGTNAALVAQRGYRAERSVLESSGGFFEVVGGIDAAGADPGADGGWGESWDIVTDMAIKLMPGGHPFHAIAEAAANAVRDGDIAPAQVASIEIFRPSLSAFVTGPRHPSDLISMAHSPAYFAAAGVADGGLTWAHASADKIADPEIHRLIDLVEITAEARGDVERYRQGATVTVRTHDGKVSASTVYLPKGAGALGIAWDDVDAKYRALVPAAGLADRQVDASLALLHEFGRVRHAAALIGLLRVRPGG